VLGPHGLLLLLLPLLLLDDDDFAARPSVMRTWMTTTIGSTTARASPRPMPGESPAPLSRGFCTPNWCCFFSFLLGCLIGGAGWALLYNCVRLSDNRI